MDLMAYSQETFEKIKSDYLKFSASLTVPDIHFIPISALNGDNVVEPMENMPWYKGNTLLSTLENVDISKDSDFKQARFPVQWVIRPQSNEYHDFRGYAGRVEGGVFKVGDEVMALPAGLKSKIKSIELMDKKFEEAYPPMSVTITLEDEIDISRGDMIVKSSDMPTNSQEIELMICWLNEKKLQVGGKYIVKHTTKESKCVIREIVHKININNLQTIEGDHTVGLNDIAKIKIKTASPLFSDSYTLNRATGSLIIIDEFSNETLGAGMII
jgi:sulfate adenylyltransferase subunit 1